MKGPLRIPARGDGHALAAELFLPRGPPRAAVLIAGAMAVRAAFYAPLARYLAEQGAAAGSADRVHPVRCAGSTPASTIGASATWRAASTGSRGAFPGSLSSSSATAPERS